MQQSLRVVSLFAVSVSALLALLYPYGQTEAAVVPAQWAAHNSCVVYRGQLVDSIMPAAVNGIPVCDRGGDAASQRIYDLEVAVQQLEAQNMQLNARLAGVSAQNGSGTVQSTNAGLEARVAALENTSTQLQQLLKAVVGMLVQVLAAVTSR